MMTLSQPGILTTPSFEELRDGGRKALEAGRLDEALRLFDEALEIARKEGGQQLKDLAFCNRSGVLINLGRQDEVLSGLREILVRNGNAENCVLAAYNLSRAQVRNKQYKKGLFYARIARDRAQTLQVDDWLAASYNQIANCLMDESYFKEAAVEYRRALALDADEKSVAHATMLANLGYCLMMQGQMKEGLTYSFVSLRRLRRLKANLYEAWPLLDLCYAYLELGRVDRARYHGRRALAIAEGAGDLSLIKIALFMLGEVEKAADDYETAYGCFAELQRRFYADSPEMAGVMVAVGMRQIVNLRA